VVTDLSNLGGNELKKYYSTSTTCTGGLPYVVTTNRGAISAEGHVKSHASHAPKKEGNQYFGRAVRIAVRTSDPDK